MTKHILKNKFLPVIILVLTCFFIFLPNSRAAEYTIMQLTHNNYSYYYNNGTPQISNGQVVWSGWDGNSWQIFLYDGAKSIQDGTNPIQLSHNNYNNYNPQIDNGKVVWAGYDGNGSQIFFYDGTKTTKLTNNKYNDWAPRISNGQVVWQGWADDDAYYSQIFLYNGTEVIQLTNNNYDNCLPDISNGQVVWQGWNSNTYNFQVFLYNGTEVIQLTNNNYNSENPQISNGQVVWHGQKSDIYQVFFYDGTKIAQLTNNNYGNWFPQINNGQIAWSGGQYYPQIFLYDGVKTTQLTNNSYYNFTPQISNGQATWQGWDGVGQIFLYNGTEVIKLTNNNYYRYDYYPQISNGQVVWSGWDGNYWQIFLAKPDIVVEQPTFTIFDGSDFSAGRDVATDTEQIVSTIKAGNASSVEGVTTDGVTRLLLVVDVPQSGAVKFSLVGGTGNSKEDGVLRVLGGFQEGDILDVSTVTTTEGEKAFCIYQAPEDFVRRFVDNNNDGKPDDETVSERTISIKVEYNNGSPIEKQIRLVRPPLVLIHGIWSSYKMWSENDFLFSLISQVPGIHVFMIDYEERNASHFTDNKDVPYSCKGNSLSSIRGVYKNTYKIAMIQADVLGYSMGGVLARIWAGENNILYKRFNNFLVGDFNKLITLDTPHKGSFLAEAGIRCINSTHSKSMDRILKEMDKHGQCLTKGAAADLMMSSDAIKDMNKVKTLVLCHALVGNYSEAYLTVVTTPKGTKWVIEGLPYTENLGFGFWFSPYAILNALIEEGYGYTVVPFINIGTDLVVDIDSQAGGLDSAYTSVYDHHHMAVTYGTVLQRVIELLNANSDSGLFADKFPGN